MVSSLSPREIVSELDRFVVGQNKAKRAVAVALRNRWRRQALKGEMKNEVLPKNILMIGPTGVGKTEISRRLSKLAEAPFVKVEATRFTEVVDVRDVAKIHVSSLKNHLSDNKRIIVTSQNGISFMEISNTLRDIFQEIGKVYIPCLIANSKAYDNGDDVWETNIDNSNQYKTNQLSKLKEQINSIDNCNLKNNSKNLIMGDGNINSPIMLIGETPGKIEEKAKEGEDAMETDKA